MEDKRYEWEAELSLKKPAILCGVLILLAAIVFCGILTQDELYTMFRGGETMVDANAPAKQMLDTRFIVVIDAGHGGHDGGAVGSLGGVQVIEAEVTQVLAQRVLELLGRHEETFLAVPGHAFGTYVTPMERANTAARLDADLLVSLHLNADTSAYTRGYQVFPAPPGRMYHQESLRFASLLTQQVAETGIPILGTNGVYYAYYPKIYGGYTKEIWDAAQVDAENPPAHESFGVVDYPGCPAVLAELWHISSPEDMRQFYNEQGCEAMAQCVYRAICDYFSVVPME